MSIQPNELDRLFRVLGNSRAVANVLKVSTGCTNENCKDIRSIAAKKPAFLALAIEEGISLDWDACDLQFDHIDQNTKYRNRDGKTVDPSNMLKSGNGFGGSRYAWETIRAEILKCRILCGNCHSNHSKNQRGGK